MERTCKRCGMAVHLSSDDPPVWVDVTGGDGCPPDGCEGDVHIVDDEPDRAAEGDKLEQLLEPEPDRAAEGERIAFVIDLALEGLSLDFDKGLYTSYPDLHREDIDRAKAYRRALADRTAREHRRAEAHRIREQFKLAAAEARRLEAAAKRAAAEAEAEAEQYAREQAEAKKRLVDRLDRAHERLEAEAEQGGDE